MQPFFIKGPKCVRCPCSLGQQYGRVCSSPFHWDYDRPPWDRLCYTSCRFGWSKGAGADFRVIQNWQFRIFLNASLQICSLSRPGCSTLLTRVRLAAREGREEERIPAQVNRRKRWPWDPCHKQDCEYYVQDLPLDLFQSFLFTDQWFVDTLLSGRLVQGRSPTSSRS